MILDPAEMGTDHGSWGNESVNVVQTAALSRVFGGFFGILIGRFVEKSCARIETNSLT